MRHKIMACQRNNFQYCEATNRDNVKIVWNKYMRQYHISVFLTGSTASVGEMQKLQSETYSFTWPVDQVTLRQL